MQVSTSSRAVGVNLFVCRGDHGLDAGPSFDTCDHHYHRSTTAASSTCRHTCRRQYEAMVGFVDETVGNLTSLLQAKGWWNDTLMIFTADNGGSIGTDENAASNYPLRGGKVSESVCFRCC